MNMTPPETAGIESKSLSCQGDLPLAELRRWGRRVVDDVVAYYNGLESSPVTSKTAPGDLRRTLPASAPEQGEDMGRILDDVERLIVPGLTHWNHPSFFAYFNSSTSGPALLAEMLAAAWNVNTMLWTSAPAAAELEEVVLDWLRQALALPAEFRGRIYDGGSASTLHALAAARQWIGTHDWRQQGGHGTPRLRVYVSPHTHSSVDKAVMLLGLGLESIRRVEADGEHCLSPESLEAAITEDRADGWLPWCVVGTVGTTSCTSIDPLDRIGEICRRHQLWLHVDAAHGGALALLPEKRDLFSGWEKADSIVVNPHKWLMVPIGASTLYTRHPSVLRDAFCLTPAYLRTDLDSEVSNAMDDGITLGRPFRALKLWFVLRAFGVQGLAARLRRHLELASELAGEIDRHPSIERLTPVPMSTICFRARPAGVAPESLDELNEHWLRAINATGKVFLSHTELDGRFVLRFVISGLRTEKRHVDSAWRMLQETLRQVVNERASAKLRTACR